MERAETLRNRVAETAQRDCTFITLVSTVDAFSFLRDNDSSHDPLRNLLYCDDYDDVNDECLSDYSFPVFPSELFDVISPSFNDYETVVQDVTAEKALGPLPLDDKFSLSRVVGVADVGEFPFFFNNSGINIRTNSKLQKMQTQLVRLAMSLFVIDINRQNDNLIADGASTDDLWAVDDLDALSTLDFFNDVFQEVMRCKDVSMIEYGDLQTLLGYCGVYRNGVSQGFSLPMVTYDSTISPTISDLSDLDDPMLSAHLITRDVLSSIVIDEFSIVPLEPNVVTRVSISFALSASLGGLCLVLLLVSIMLVTVGMHQYILRFAVTYMSVAAVLKSKTAGQARREDVERVCQKICGTRSKKQSMDSVVQSALVQLSESYGIPVETLQPKNKNWMTQQSTFVSLVFLVFFTLLSVLAGI
ncbi:hypothetical protein ADUPG1_007434, partial [Aduncisulcus paluster]